MSKLLRNVLKISEGANSPLVARLVCANTTAHLGLQNVYHFELCHSLAVQAV